ncbi:putative Ribosomal RNA methyltransferase FtsJ domain-containing protein [Seiridium cardinale]
MTNWLMRGLPKTTVSLNGALLRPLASAACASSRCLYATPVVACRSTIRYSSSNSRWKQRQGNDFFAREAKVQGLKSRAAFKLLEMDSKYKLFRKGQMVVDLGYAPGSWSQVAQERTKPNGQIVGIDLLPAQPPKGVSTIQGNFLSPAVQNVVKGYLQEFARKRPEYKRSAESDDEDSILNAEEFEALLKGKPSYVDTERADTADHDPFEDAGRLVDVVLSDMSEPWVQTSGFSSNTLSNPYRRMMNTSGMSFRDHAGSMDLCLAALQFASDTLRTGGHFVCKFYQGSEDKDLELKLKKMFGKVSREKPESSRNESREAYFVALRRKGDVSLSDITK